MKRASNDDPAAATTLRRLRNGMTVIVREIHSAPVVAIVATACTTLAVLLVVSATRVSPFATTKTERNDAVVLTKIHDLAKFGADPHEVVKRLEDEPDVSARRALILSLGEFPADRTCPPTDDPGGIR